jgi:AcrR family transcriptional regulator
LSNARKRMSAAERREVIATAATEVFAERGYHGASIDEIARRSGVSPPVVYDHFDSKKDLHKRLLERHYADLRAVWREHLAGDEPLERRISRAVDAWYGYVESHPYAGRMLFQDTTGDPEIQALHRGVQLRSRALVMPLLAQETGGTPLPGSDAEQAVEMAWEAFRGVLQSLALWWYEHPHVPRAQIVTVAMNSVWIGFERVVRGELWLPPAGG